MATVLLMGFVAIVSFQANSEKIVILHTNDTHSAIDPFPDGAGGALQRKAIIDSVRATEKNVITVDAGDMVQGSLYFKFFKGDVSYPVMNMTGYDIRILGNHEFDNGMKALADKYRFVKANCLASNYDFTGTELEGIFKPYVIIESGNEKIGFIGLNVDPKGIIRDKNINVRFREILPTANELASYLKEEEGCKAVVAVTHIGYEDFSGRTSDLELAKSSRDIDVIIGGHSHDLIDPEDSLKTPSVIKNLKGKPVRIGQTGKFGKYIGKITIDTDRAERDDYIPDYELIAVTDRFPPESLDSPMDCFLMPFREEVKKKYSEVIACCALDMENERTGGMANMTADIIFEYGKQLLDSLGEKTGEKTNVDLSIMNVGGIRDGLKKGEISTGQILNIYPFPNNVMIIALKGADIIEALKVAAQKGGEAVSENIRVLLTEDGEFIKVMIDGEELDPLKEYIVATINYLAEGNDDMPSLANNRVVYETQCEVNVPVIEWMKKQNSAGRMVSPDCKSRFVKQL